MRLETAPTGDGGKYRITDLFSETSFRWAILLRRIGNEIYGVCQLRTDDSAITGCFFAKSFIMTLH